jgi:hypothetical protein
MTPTAQPMSQPSRSAAKEIAKRSGRRTHYDVLQVSQQAEEAVIQAAYRALARANHPDHNGTEKAAERMRELNEAYEVLSNPRQRAAYDLSLNHDRPVSTVETDPVGKVRRRTSCWRCHDPLEGAFGRYCGDCHWILCEACNACGCERGALNRLGRPMARRYRWTMLAGWLTAALISVGWAAFIATMYRWAG